MSDNWGRWGATDELGALNLVTPEVTRKAAGLVRTGRTLSLAAPLGPSTPTSPHRTPPSRYMDRDAGDYALGARAPGGFKFAEDTVHFATHSGTHVDALAHTWSGDELYNGHPAAGIRSTRGAQHCGADKLRPVVTRGVLIDMVRAHGGPLPPRAAVTAQDLERHLFEVDVHLEPGDAVFIRTGWWETRGGSDDYFADEPGIDEAAAQWLAERDVAIVGADNYAVEQQSDVPGFPAHLVLMHQHGVPLIEGMELVELAGTLAELQRSTFMLSFAPVPLVGSTASPVTPVAVL